MPCVSEVMVYVSEMMVSVSVADGELQGSHQETPDTSKWEIK